MKWLVIGVIWVAVWFAWVGSTRSSKFSLLAVLGTGLVALVIWVMLAGLSDMLLSRSPLEGPEDRYGRQYR